MKRILIHLLKIIGSIIVLMFILCVSIGVLLNTKFVQNKLLRKSTDLLTERLHTAVRITSVDVDFLTYDIRLNGLEIEDLQQKKMLQIEHLATNVELLPLLKRQVKISSIEIVGLNANIYKLSPDSAANYQFVIDAFKKQKNDSIAQADSVTLKQTNKEKTELEFDIKKVTLERIHVEYKDRKDYLVSFQKLDYNKKRQRHFFDIGNLHFVNDNHQPRKNTGKVSRGAFDVGHLDVKANMKLSVCLLSKDSVIASIDHLDATDSITGIQLEKLRLSLHANKQMAHLSEIEIKTGETNLFIDEADIHLPNKSKETPLTYSASTIHGQVMLKDIAKPFAPVLSKFSIPLLLNVGLTGDDQSMEFNNIRVSTYDKRFLLSANGRLTNLKDKHKMAIRFNVSDMKARKGIKEHIINQFSIKKFMMQQLHTLGDITYRGNIAILWKREEFQGLLSTAVGHLNFKFALDESNKYVIGQAHTNDILLGQVFDLKDIGAITANADFRFDISKQRTAKMRKQKGGKLPIGEVTASIAECSYKKLKVRNLLVDIKSDGAIAEGNITVKGFRTDLLCAFSFTSTDSIKSKLKIKPSIRFHGLSEKDHQTKEDKALQKQLEKENRKQQKTIQKQEKAARKQEEKERKRAKKMNIQEI